MDLGLLIPSFIWECGGVFIFHNFFKQHRLGTGDLQPLPMVEGLASGALEAVVGVGRMDLHDHHPHLQCDLGWIASSVFASLTP